MSFIEFFIVCTNVHGSVVTLADSSVCLSLTQKTPLCSPIRLTVLNFAHIPDPWRNKLLISGGKPLTSE